ncbi:hypothetical protein [Streptomyces sp. NPDC052107]|uniref:hypothetical protein n=1 Tax=Streptomyces sp. NPDC052107 TaxID=3155632 RepID=UPI003426C784
MRWATRRSLPNTRGTVNQHEDGRYRHEEKLPFGASVKLPDPVNITLDTEPLKEFSD